MKASITINEENIGDQVLEKIVISGALNHQEALEAAEEWCEENNCLLVSKEFDKLVHELEDSSTFFYARITTDDYY